MISLRTVLKPADNSGAKLLTVIHVDGGSRRRFARLGDIVTCVVNEALPNGQVKDAEVVKVVIVRTRKEYGRTDGSYIRFDDNAGVVLDNVENKEPKATRIFGPVAREVKDLGFSKIASLASEVL